jgi:NAD(P)-dependent dehydrogenase (short-subunit alcohol dehydrogenase family)
VKVIVTGGNSGIGAATAATLAAAGHSVVIACRTIPKAERVAATMSADATIAHLDLADLTSVRKFADSVDGVAVLINNAGVLGLPLTRTSDGFEAHMELAQPQVLQVVGLRRIEIGRHAVQSRVDQAGRAELPDRSGCDGHRHHPGHHRGVAVGA